MEDRIEQRIAIRATQDKVWQLVSRPGWWLPGSDAEPARGPGRMSIEYGGDDRPYVIDVIRVEPPGSVSFRWASALGGVAPVPGNATLIEFYIRPVGEETGVTVVESGFSSLDLPEALREDEWKGNTGGWQYELSGLRTSAEQYLPGGRPPAPPEKSHLCSPTPPRCSPIRAGFSPRWPIRAAVSCSNC
jgi:hypothetical protein